MAFRLVSVALVAKLASVGASSSSAAANPIRKVVTMLQTLKAKVEAEGEREQELYEKYMCYCKTSSGALQKSVAEAETKVPELQAALNESVAQKSQLDEDLVQHKEDREAAKAAVAEATHIREKAAKEYADLKASFGDDIVAIEKAVAAIENGMSGSFLQAKAALMASLTRVLQKRASDMLDEDREEVVAFLQGGQEAGYAPKSGQIVGILKQLGDSMAKGLSEATAAEKEAIKEYDELMAAKKKEVQSLTASIETKSERVGEVAVSIANIKNEIGDTAEALVDDRAFLADLEKNCDTKAAQWEAIVKTRSEELVALSDTIKILNDDDALDLFKKALPSPAASFMQVVTTAESLKQRALSTLKISRDEHKPEFDFIALALKGKKIGFEKIIALIDELVVVLKKEQGEDDSKKTYCGVELDTSEDRKNNQELAISDSESAIADAEESLGTLKSEIAALEDGIKSLDKMVAEATEQRKDENEDFKELMAQDSAAKDLINFAKNRLNKFYNPKLYVPPPTRELSEEDNIAVSFGGTAAPTPAPGGIVGTGIEAPALVQIKAHSTVDDKVAPPPPPESFGPYAKKTEGSGGVIAMMDLLVKDLTAEMTAAEADEKNAQADYEKAMSDAAAKRAEDSKALSDKQAAKADTEGALQTHTDEKMATSKELQGTLQYIQSLHSECDWLLQYFDARKQARADEVTSLENAKAVLSGADFAL